MVEKLHTFGGLTSVTADTSARTGPNAMFNSDNILPTQFSSAESKENFVEKITTGLNNKASLRNQTYKTRLFWSFLSLVVLL